MEATSRPCLLNWIQIEIYAIQIENLGLMVRTALTVTNVAILKKFPMVKKLLRMRKALGRTTVQRYGHLGDGIDLTIDVVREQGVIIVTKTRKVGKKCLIVKNILGRISEGLLRAIMLQRRRTVKSDRV
jgi:hypothetical protein